MGIGLGFGNLLGRIGTTIIVDLHLWWVMEGGWSFERINGVRLNCCMFSSFFHMPYHCKSGLDCRFIGSDKRKGSLEPLFLWTFKWLKIEQYKGFIFKVVRSGDR